MTLTITQKFRLLHVASHSAALWGLWYVWHTRDTVWLWLSLAMFLYAGIIGVNVSLHRYWSHRSFKTGPLREWMLLVSSFFPMLGSPAAWGTVHIYHHAHSDDDKDPHSPKNAGLFGSWFTFWPKMQIPVSIYRRFANDDRLKFLHRHYFKLAIAYVLILAAINPLLVPFLWAIPAVGCFHGAASVAVIPHLKWIPGNYRSHDTRDNSCNSFLTTILSLGEGWHNNHHFRSGSYRHGEKWWEIDVSAWIIKHLLST
jgi:fatty-acid desaturase